MLSALQPPFFNALSDSKRILIAGMGGFDVFCGLPLYFALRAEGREVTLANLSFAKFSPNPLAPPFVEVTPEMKVARGTYFPEYHLACWLQERGEESRVYAIKKQGVQPVLEAYQTLAQRLELDTIILIDGGTDSLMRGDESGLGTPHEDAISLTAVNELGDIKQFVVSLGFGIDAYHGVSHWDVLEATAELATDGAFLGSFSLSADMPPVQLYMDACEYAFERMPEHVSIVNASILSAIQGYYGDFHLTERTQGSELWINPLMSQYWCYDLGAVAERLQYREALLGTQTFAQVDLAIRAYRAGITPRERRTLPI